MATTEEAMSGEMAVEAAEAIGKKRASRRQLLRLAGATLAGAAGAAALKGVPAAAANGDPVTVGSTFSESLGNSTGVFSYASTYGGALRGTNNAGTGVFGYAFNNGTGVLGYTYGGTYGYGVRGTSTTGVSGSGSRFGVFGAGNSAGVHGQSNNSSGVEAVTYATGSRALTAYTAATNSVAVYGFSLRSEGARLIGYGVGMFAYGYASYGAWVQSRAYGLPALYVQALNYGPDVFLGGTGRLMQRANAAGPGAPSFSPIYTEVVRTADSGVWASSGIGSGQGAWKRINALRVDTADGTGGNYLPFRVIDTRGGVKPAKNSFTSVTIAGQGSGAQTIPSNAIAVVGNLTATGWSGPGYLSVIPWTASPTPPTTSSINFGGSAQSAIANSFVIGLNAGKLMVFAGAAACNFLIDITGYIQ